jgi:hypothetical protein
MGGMFGASDPSGGGGINSSVGLARIAQANPAIGGILGQMGYTGPSGPQQPVGTAGGNMTPQQTASINSGLNNVTGYGKNLMAGQPLGATGAPGTNAAGKPAATPSLLPAAWQPQVAQVQMPINPYAQQASPGSMQPMGAGGRNPQFFPFFRGN